MKRTASGQDDRFHSHRSDIDIKKIKDHIPQLIGYDLFFKAAVCIPLIKKDSSYDVLFEVRPDHIADQPGDVCLPGGEMENGETAEQAAIRECCEELLIRPEQIEILGAADYIHVGNTVIYPFAGILKDYKNTFSKDEVAEVFSVPIEFFLKTEPDRYEIDAKVIPAENFPYELISGGKDYKWRSRKSEELFYQYDGHVIWGLTARMIRAFCELI